MADQTPPTPPTPPAAPSGIEIVYRGEKRTLDPTEAARLAQIGLSDENRRASLQEREGRLKALEQEHEQYLRIGRELGGFAQANPQAGAVIRDVWGQLAAGQISPDEARRRLTGAGLGDDDDAPPTSGHRQPPQAESSQLAQELSALRQEIQSIRTESTTRQADQAISEALESDEFLGTLKGAHGHARLIIAREVANGLDIGQATAVASREIKELRSAAATQKRDALREQEATRLAPAGAGTPIFNPQELTVEVPEGSDRRTAMKATRDHLRRLAADFQRRALSGPTG